MKDDGPKQLGRIRLERRPVQAVARPRDPAARHAQLVALSERYGVPALDLEQVCLRTEDLGNVPRSLAQHHLLIPVLARADRLFVAMTDPSQEEVIQEVEFVAGKRVYAYAAPAEDIAEAIERAYHARERGAEHFVGASCPPETLRKAGLLADPAAETPPEHEVPPAAPAPEPGPTDDGAPLAGAGPTATVSAYPPRRSSLPPASDGAEDADTEELLEEVQQAFDDLLDDETAVSCVSQLLPAVEPRQGARGTVLVAEADALSRGLIERTLLDDGYDVRVADNGRQALRIVKENPPDLLIVSALLPEVHGFEIAQRLRGSRRYGALPIVMIGAEHRGFRWAEDQRESCGVKHYLEQPLDPQAVSLAVSRALAEEERTGEGRSELGRAEISALAEHALEEGMLAYRRGDIGTAIGHLERGVAIDPLAYRLHFHLGLLLARQGQIYDAIRALERAVEINSKHFAGVKNLAIMYGQAGFRNRAVELWRRGLALAPDEETRSAIREHLAGLLSQEGLS